MTLSPRTTNFRLFSRRYGSELRSQRFPDKTIFCLILHRASIETSRFAHRALNVSFSTERITNVKTEVSDSERRAEVILAELKNLVSDFDTKEEDVREKMARWPGLLEKLQGLLENVTEANKTAHDAIKRGEDTLKKALEMLETLQVK